MLKENTMLSIVTISCWSGRKYDRKVSKDVDIMYNAENSGRFNKILLDMSALKKVFHAVGKARDLHTAMTMPWLDTGARLLPVKLYMEYVQKMRQAKDHFEKVVADFIADYPNLVQKAEQNLGDMFKQSDYPSASDMAKKFDFIVTIIPVPDSDDIRLNLNDDDIDRIRRDAQATTEYTINNAMRSIWNRLREAVDGFHGMLADSDRKIFTSIANKVGDMCELAEKLNFTDDEHLYACVDTIRNNLVIQDVDDIRKDKDFREETAGLAKDILDKIDDVIRMLP